jgi:ubiquinone/menaquinone biosynthesis C-methylase UbiE
MTHEVYRTPADALSATDEFYGMEGFQYTEDLVEKWLARFVKLPTSGKVLDLCCGDAIWSKGIRNLNSDLDLYGIDISKGGISKAVRLLKSDQNHFVLGDAETRLPFPDDFFDLIFARGPGLYNQHSMDRPSTIKIIEGWHRKLARGGQFYSIFASNPKKMGTYTDMEDVKLPYNRCPRKTEAVDFRGGKYHHTIESFLTPFWKAQGVRVVNYQFVGNMHILITKKEI